MKLGRKKRNNGFDLRIRFQIQGFFNVVRLKKINKSTSFSVDSLDNSWQKIRGTPCKEVGMGIVKPWQRYAFSECLLVAVMITFSLKWSIVVLVLLGNSECHNWQVLIIAKTLNELKWITAIFCDLVNPFIYLLEKHQPYLISWKKRSTIDQSGTSDQLLLFMNMYVNFPPDKPFFF